mmetsp:Transcript_18821/g.47763  ORF Transcript_18821/g.47763 Transcript_18821/m.47763 type:complete len:380 (-) Transcript_18821:347-1486(-)
MSRSSSPGKVPSYAQPLSIHKAAYRNAEQDTVRNAFAPGSFTQIRTMAAVQNDRGVSSRSCLPKKIAPDFCSTARTDAPLDERLKESQSLTVRSAMSTSSLGGENHLVNGTLPVGKYSPAPRLFSHFQYQESLYDLQKQMKREDLTTSKSKMITGEDFKVPAAKAVPQHLGTFEDLKYLPEPYDSKDLVMLETRKSERSKIIAGPFIAGGSTKSRLKLEKGRVQEAVDALFFTLKEDWPRAFRKIVLDDRGYIQIFFLRSEMSEGNVIAYMNQLVRTNETISRFGFHKHAGKWGVTDASFAVFTLHPPWVSEKVTDSFYTLHPEVSTLSSFTATRLGANAGKKTVENVPHESKRMPFAPQTDSGVQIPTFVRNSVTVRL